MERITAKEVTSMMQAVAQVYEQPEQSEDNTILEFEDTEYLRNQLKQIVIRRKQKRKLREIELPQVNRLQQELD